MPRLLIVEDDDLNREVLGRRLLRHGYQVVSAADGNEALALALTELPDLILIDLVLPGLDGWETIGRLRANDRTRSIPIIVVSARVDPADHDRAIAVGCDEFETKPVNFRRLLARIEARLHPDGAPDATSPDPEPDSARGVTPAGKTASPASKPVWLPSGPRAAFAVAKGQARPAIDDSAEALADGGSIPDSLPEPDPTAPAAASSGRAIPAGPAASIEDGGHPLPWTAPRPAAFHERARSVEPCGEEAVLVIDCNDRRRPILASALVPRWPGTLLLASPAAGLDMLLRQRIDVVLLDATSAAGDAPAVLESLKTDDTLREIPVIALCSREAAEFFIEAGADDLLLPPFDPPLVQLRVATVLERQRLRASVAAAAGPVPPPLLPERYPNRSGVPAPRRIEHAALLVAGLSRFPAKAKALPVEDTVAAVQTVFGMMEDIAGRHGLIDIGTVGHRFVAAAGLDGDAGNAALAAVRCGLDMIRRVDAALPVWPLTVGIDAGPVLAGLFGRRLPRFDLLGHPAETARQIQRLAQPGGVLLSEGVWLPIASHCEGEPAGALSLHGTLAGGSRAIPLYRCTAADGAPATL